MPSTSEYYKVAVNSLIELHNAEGAAAVSQAYNEYAAAVSPKCGTCNVPIFGSLLLTIEDGSYICNSCLNEIIQPIPCGYFDRYGNQFSTIK